MVDEPLALLGQLFDAVEALATDASLLPLSLLGVVLDRLGPGLGAFGF